MQCVWVGMLLIGHIASVLHLQVHPKNHIVCQRRQDLDALINFVSQVPKPLAPSISFATTFSVLWRNFGYQVSYSKHYR